MLTPGSNLGPRAPKAAHSPTVPPLLLLFPLRTRLTSFNHYLKERVTNEANYNLLLAAQLQSEGGVRVCGYAVLLDFWCGFAEIYILSCDILVLQNQASGLRYLEIFG